jgi:uncharacterized membrane protein required for colicin V production
LNWLDVVLAAVLVGFAVRGLRRGFLRELFSLVGLFLGLWIALLTFEPVGEWVQQRWALAEPLPFHLAFLAIFLSVACVVGMVGYWLQRLARGLLMGWLDAVVGLGFGTVKGVMLLTVLLFLVVQLPLAEALKTPLGTSTVAKYLERFNPFLERSVQAYRRLGGDRLWEQFRAPEANRPPAMSEGRRAGDAVRR